VYSQRHARCCGQHSSSCSRAAHPIIYHTHSISHLRSFVAQKTQTQAPRLSLSRPAHHRHDASCSWSFSPSFSRSPQLLPVAAEPTSPPSRRPAALRRLPLHNVAALLRPVVALSDPVPQPRMCTAQTQIAAANSGAAAHANKSAQSATHKRTFESARPSHTCSSCSSTVAAPLAKPRAARQSSRLRVRREPLSPLLVRGQGAVDASAPPAVVELTPCSTVAGAARLLGCSIAVKGSGVATSEIYPGAISATFGSVPCACVLVSPLYYKPSVKPPQQIRRNGRL